MKRSYLITAFYFNISIINSQVTLPLSNPVNLGKAVTIGDFKGSVEPGTIRWTGNDFQGFNGISWISLTGSKIVEVIEDIDGNSYRTLRISGKRWMIDELITSRFRNGQEIEIITSNSAWNLANFPGRSYNPDFSEEQVRASGMYYNKHCLTNNICPSGFRLPNKDDIESLIESAGSNPNYYFEMLWNEENGRRSSNGQYDNSRGFWWTNSTNTQDDNISFLIVNRGGFITLKQEINISRGFPIRCVSN